MLLISQEPAQKPFFPWSSPQVLRPQASFSSILGASATFHEVLTIDSYSGPEKKKIIIRGTLFISPVIFVFTSIICLLLIAFI